MAQRNVEQLIGRLATDPGFRARFSRDAGAVLADELRRGCDLTRVELDALASIDTQALHAFAAALDERIRRIER
jgi:hypothetical protein